MSDKTVIWAIDSSERRYVRVEDYEKIKAERDALRSLLNDAIRDAEWKDKRIFPFNLSEPYQNWAATVWLPVPLSESDKSPEAALERTVATAIAERKKK